MRLQINEAGALGRQGLRDPLLVDAGLGAAHTAAQIPGRVGPVAIAPVFIGLRRLRCCAGKDAAAEQAQYADFFRQIHAVLQRRRRPVRPARVIYQGIEIGLFFSVTAVPLSTRPFCSVALSPIVMAPLCARIDPWNTLLAPSVVAATGTQ